jgi:hypothetical protein
MAEERTASNDGSNSGRPLNTDGFDTARRATDGLTMFQKWGGAVVSIVGFTIVILSGYFQQKYVVESVKDQMITVVGTVNELKTEVQDGNKAIGNLAIQANGTQKDMDTMKRDFEDFKRETREGMKVLKEHDDMQERDAAFLKGKNSGK